MLGFDTLARDLRFSLRALARNPGFTCVAMLTIALGVGAKFFEGCSVWWQGVVLGSSGRSLAPADRLVFLWQNRPGVLELDASYPNFEDWQRTSRSFRLDVGNRLSQTSISLRPEKRST